MRPAPRWRSRQAIQTNPDNVALDGPRKSLNSSYALISEIGASLMVGGNIRGQTRVLTTATVLETGKGNFDVAIALSLILLGITFLVNWALTWIQQRRRPG